MYKSKVRLISYTQPSDEMYYDQIKDIQDLVAYCARVSNPDNQHNSETSENLIKYLIKNKHWSPLEMVSACLEITTTRDIARQILRHRSFSFQEFSQRYADPTKSLDFVLREARFQDTKNRQNSIDMDVNNSKHNFLQYQFENLQKNLTYYAKEYYTWAIEKGLAKETARAMLPEGLMESRIYMNGTLRSWVHYIDLRSSNGTQKEHREIAIKCRDVISKVFPMIKNHI